MKTRAGSGQEERLRGCGADLDGSVRQKAATCSPDASLGRYLAFCSLLPAKMMPCDTHGLFSGGEKNGCHVLTEHASFT